MIEQPDQDTQRMPPPPSGRLVLPAPPEQTYRREPNQFAARPERLIQRPPEQIPQESPIARLKSLWRKDPAYQILSLAIVMVVLASIVFVALAANAVINGNNANASLQQFAARPNPPTPVGTVDNKPTFPTPATKPGSGVSSQPSAQPQPTPTFQPTPTTNPTNVGALSVQILSVPNNVDNNSRVSVAVQTSQPNVTVKLQAVYQAAPFLFTSAERTTDNAGNATLTWNIKLFAFRGTSQATITVIAMNDQGQQVNSSPASVTIQIN